MRSWRGRWQGAWTIETVVAIDKPELVMFVAEGWYIFWKRCCFRDQARRFPPLCQRFLPNSWTAIEFVPESLPCSACTQFQDAPPLLTACNSASAHSPPIARSPQSVTLGVPIGQELHYTVLLWLRLWNLGYHIRRNLIEALVIKADPLPSQAPDA